MEQRIYFFHMNESRYAEYLQLCKGLGIETCIVPEQKHCLSIGHIAGIPGVSARAAEDADQRIGEEMLLLFGLDGRALNTFLAAVREAGIRPVALKAVVTPVNSRWSASRLFAELQKERSAMREL